MATQEYLNFLNSIHSLSQEDQISALQQWSQNIHDRATAAAVATPPHPAFVPAPPTLVTHGGYFEANYKAPNIVKYKGVKDKPILLRSFIRSLTSAFFRSPFHFANEESKVFFIMDHLDGDALSWAENLIPKSSVNPRNNYETKNKPEEFLPFKTAEAFIEALNKEFRSLDWENQTYDELVELKQGKHSVRDYSNSFNALSRELDLPDLIKFNMYRRGLSHTIQNLIKIMNPTPTDFSTLEEAALRLDTPSKEITFISGLSQKSATNAITKEKVHSNKTSRYTGYGNSYPAVNLPDPAAMEIDVLKNVTKQRYLEYDIKGRNAIRARRTALGLCTFCGSDKHKNINGTCPARKSGKS